MDGGGVKDWPMKRRIISWGATVLAMPLVEASDPMSGFFTIRKSLLNDAHYINPTGMYDLFLQKKNLNFLKVLGVFFFVCCLF